MISKFAKLVSEVRVPCFCMGSDEILSHPTCQEKPEKSQVLQVKTAWREAERPARFTLPETNVYLTPLLETVQKTNFSPSFEQPVFQRAHKGPSQLDIFLVQFNVFHQFSWDAISRANPANWTNAVFVPILLYLVHIIYSTNTKYTIHNARKTGKINKWTKE